MGTAGRVHQWSRNLGGKPLGPSLDPAAGLLLVRLDALTAPFPGAYIPAVATTKTKPAFKAGDQVLMCSGRSPSPMATS